MAKKSFYAVFVLVFALVIISLVSCASTGFPESPIKKGKREYTISDRYVFDEEGRELSFEGYEKLGDYEDPNLWNEEVRQADYDENGRLIRVFIDGDRTYPEERFYSYDEEGNLISDEEDYMRLLLEGIEKSDRPVSEEKESDGTWEKYEYADDGSYTYINNRGYNNDLIKKSYDSEGRLVYEKDFYGNETWYDTLGRITRKDYHYIEYDDQDRIIYEKFDENTVAQIWRGFDEEGRQNWFKELETNELSPDWDELREIEVTYDKEGFPTYIIEKIYKHLNSEEMEYICTERFYINKYSYYENGQMNECRQYRYLNRTDEWIPNN